MIFDRLLQLHLRVKRAQSALKGFYFFRMLGNPQIAESDRNLSRSVQKLTHQIGGKRSADHSIDGNHCQPPRTWSVCGNAYNRNLGTRSPSDAAAQVSRTAREHDDSANVRLQGSGESFFFAFSQLRVSAVFDLYALHAQRFGLSLNARPYFIPKGGRAFQGVYREAKLALQ